MVWIPFDLWKESVKKLGSRAIAVEDLSEEELAAIALTEVRVNIEDEDNEPLTCPDV